MIEASQLKGHENLLQLGRQIIVFIGPEGSGKSAIASRLAANSQKPYITTGGIFRDMAVNDPTEFGDGCREMLKERRYLKPEMLLPILIKRFSQDDVKNGFILDGGLRLVEEVRSFPSVLQKADRVMPLTVIHLRIPGWISIERLITNTNARKREDDTLDGVLNRLTYFYKDLSQRASLIQQQENWRLAHVNAMESIDKTLNSVKNILVNRGM